MKFLYLPFDEYMNDGSYTGTIKRYKKKGHTVIESGRGWKPLRAVKAGDVLIIMGHGEKGSGGRGTLSVKRVDLHGNESYGEKSVNDLAAQLERDGLAKSHRLIKSLTCYGGGAYKKDGITNNLVGKPHEYFSQLLARALGQRGYGSIKVGGYPGTVGSTTKQKHVYFRVINDPMGNIPVDGDGEFEESTQGQIKWWDANGNPTIV